MSPDIKVSPQPKLSFLTKLASSWPSIVLFILFALLPVYGQFMPYLEGSVWPVTSKATIVSITPNGTGVDVAYTYTKYRLCELVGYGAKVGGIDTLLVPIHEMPGLATRGLGPEATRMWHLVAPSLSMTEIWVIHRCNPIWLTATKVYP